ncbi:hypothetical protein Vafri_17610 [Volvox africanus]|uniref:BAG domain-containing protein n=1 Tax=Volvox africanus TaxID=51714 RepID=A0A8J4BLC6_9CHLO|nr:hypothetical protein Vafri_17610 [Volvox africanus]GIL63565.1 hypothetical protein Vafri_17610 [Volvox africanus]
MFHMASPWNSWGLYPGHNAYPWAFNTGSHRKRTADTFDMKRLWFGEESDESDIDSYGSEAFRSRAAPFPRRSARQPHPELFNDQMTGRRFRATPRDVPSCKPLELSGAASTVRTEVTIPEARGALFNASGAAQKQQTGHLKHHRHNESQQRAAPRAAAPTASNLNSCQVRSIPVQSESSEETEVTVTKVAIEVGAAPSAATAGADEPVHPACHRAKAFLRTSERNPSQAARTIQRWWRGWRLWRHTPALRVLMALSAELRSAAARYYGYMGATEGNLTDKQHLEVNELAMRAILKLDSLEGLPGELRALRKHLTARALRLQDEVHSAYAKSTTRPTLVRQVAMDPPTAAVAAPESCTANAEGAEAAAPPAAEDTVTQREISPNRDAADPVGSSSTETAAAAAVLAGQGPNEEGGLGGSGRPSAASVVAPGDLNGSSGAAAAATAKCARAVRRRCKRVHAKHGGGFEGRNASSPTSKSLSAPVSRPPGDDVNIRWISGRLLQRLRRRFGDSAASAAVAAAAAAAAHLPPAASSRRGGSLGSGVDVGGLHKQRHTTHKKQQQQQQQQQSQKQQQPVILRVVVRSDAKGADGDNGGSIRSCRSAVLVESGVQTD